MSIEIRAIVACRGRKGCIRNIPAVIRRHVVRSTTDSQRDSGAVPWPEPNADTLPSPFHDIPSTRVDVEFGSVGVRFGKRSSAALIAVVVGITIGRTR